MATDGTIWAQKTGGRAIKNISSVKISSDYGLDRDDVNLDNWGWTVNQSEFNGLMQSFMQWITYKKRQIKCEKVVKMQLNTQSVTVGTTSYVQNTDTARTGNLTVWAGWFP